MFVLLIKLLYRIRYFFYLFVFYILCNDIIYCVDKLYLIMLYNFKMFEMINKSLEFLIF